MNLRGLVLLGFLIPGALGAQSPYPIIQNLNLKDPQFRQHQDLVALFHQRAAKNESLPDLAMFSYTLRAGDDLFALGSRFNLTYDTLATVNCLENPSQLQPGMVLLIPTIPGLFVSLDQDTGIGQLMIQSRTGTPQNLKIQRQGRMERYLFFPSTRFHPVERAFFLGILFRYPLPKGSRLTSGFGSRPSPFTGHPSFHNGIDLGAPMGTEIYAARDGQVIEAGWDALLGNYAVLQHEGDYQTVYGHMSQLGVKPGQKVYLGAIIGLVGTTGKSTGPHLHFEIRRKGHPQDPVPLLPRNL